MNVWTLDYALELIREIQPLLHAKSYHVALGGGVLNRGVSAKDLDIYVFPFNGNDDLPPILPFLEERLGRSEPIGEADGYPPDINFEIRAKIFHAAGRIDVFITKNGVVRDKKHA